MGIEICRVRALHRPLSQVMRPVIHEGTPALKQVGVAIGRPHPVPDDMR